ncbi:MAG: ferritin family protein [Thermoanaerobaculum sp.]|nr:ferritin family protein [Thermoanaerobaculum sp.]MDW7967605.1 ferritin family protein [Thermoanaerobaculum sp.]
MELAQALAVAIDYETRVRDHYAKGQEEILSPEGKKIFQVMANEEQRHLDYLLSRQEEWTRTGHLTSPELPTEVPPVELLERAKSKLASTRRGPVATQGELELLKTALELERATSSFYQELVAQLPAPYQPLFSRFLDIERGHLAIVQAEIDAIAGHGHWFDFMEFDLEAG